MLQRQWVGAVAAIWAVGAFGGVAVQYTTTADRRLAFEARELPLTADAAAPDVPRIAVDHSDVGQVLDGFGAAFTESSCCNLLKMTQTDRTRLLRETFDLRSGMGFSFLRISLGCSDFSLAEYSLCDTPGMGHFGLTEHETRTLIPVLKEILAINPKVRVMASPWTCPRWMKLQDLAGGKPRNAWTAGQLNPACYADYAQYFVRFIQAMAAQGIAIEAVSPQNEPLNKGNSASLYMGWQEQRDFIKNALGPAFAHAGLKTKIWIFDHNFNYDNIQDQQRYPLKIYADTEAARFIDGSAWHAYGGSSSELDRIRAAAPEKKIYFTEQSIGEWRGGYSFSRDLMWFAKEISLGTLKRGCSAVIVWNFMLDENHGPKRPHGCQKCLGAVDILSSDYSTLIRRSHFYLIGHLSKVFHPEARRIGLKGVFPEGVDGVAAENANGSVGIFLQNASKAAQRLVFTDGGKCVAAELPARAFAPCCTNERWHP